MSVINQQMQEELSKDLAGRINDHFASFRDVIQTNALKPNTHPQFHTAIEKDRLFNAYLAGFTDPVMRQEHDCRCCRDFLNRFGDLVTLDLTDDAYRTVSLFWSVENVPADFVASVEAMREIVESAKISSAFYTNVNTLGERRKGDYDHFAVFFPAVNPGRNLYKSPGTNMAESRADFLILTENLASHPGEDKLTEILHYFANDTQLQNYPQHVENLRWFVNLVAGARINRVNKNFHNRRWHETVTQPMGRLRIMQGVMGEFINTYLKEGASPAKRLFLKMVDPKDYMRPKAAPSEANVAQASKIVEKLGLAPALLRRSLRRDEIPEVANIWVKPTPKAVEPGDGVFAHLKTKQNDPTNTTFVMADGGSITWTKFVNKVLPEARQIHVQVSSGKMGFSSFTTAVNPEAPPILAWDNLNQRNPVGTYTYNKGSYASDWGLLPGMASSYWVGVEKVILATPALWYNAGPARDQVDAMLVLDTGYDRANPTMCIFPETLRPELHEVRATIEQYSRQGQLAGIDNGFVGLPIHAGNLGYRVKVETPTGWVSYLIDRFD